MICRHMMDTADPAIEDNRSISADDLYEYADRHGVFISFNGMACAGSTKKIHEFLEFCNSGASSDQASGFDLSAIISDPDKWYAYALATIELDCFIEHERASSAAKASAADGAQSEKSARIRKSLGDYTRSLMEDWPTGDEHASFEAGVLLRQNNILRLLGWPTIKGIPRKHFSARMGRV